MISLWHPEIVTVVYKQRAAELAREAASARIAASLAPRNRVERLFVRRREGKITWLDTVLVHRSA
jgi:hypothetical protein